MIQTPMTLAEARNHFSPARCYLDTAGFGLPPSQTVELLHREIDRWRRGDWMATEFDDYVTAARSLYAQITEVPQSWVAMGSTASSLVGLVAASLPVGSRVLCVEGDFTSLLFPFLQRANAGQIAVREVSLVDIANAMTSDVDLVAVSAVQSATGQVAELADISDRAKKYGVTTLIDGTQAVGWLPVDARRFDIVVAAAYKWLLAPRGLAFMSVQPETLARIAPVSAGWYAGDDIWSSIYGSPLRLATTARRLDVSPGLSWMGAASSLQLIVDVGVPAIHRHNVGLANSFQRGIGKVEGDSAIVTVPGETLAAELRAAGIACSARKGTTRLSFHLYNTESDVDRAIRVVSSAHK